MLLAVLERTLLDLRDAYVAKTAVARARVAEIEKWMSSDDCSATMGGFSFEFVCAQTGLAADHIRERVQEWRRPS